MIPMVNPAPILGSTGAMPFMTILLMLILFDRRKLSVSGILIGALLFASLALNAEYLFVFLWAGMAAVLAALFCIKRFRPTGEMRRTAMGWFGVLVLSAVLSLVQGGLITETARSILLSSQGQAVDQTNVYGFSVRWPFGFNTAYFDILSIFNWRQLIVLLTELGPTLLLGGAFSTASYAIAIWAMTKAPLALVSAKPASASSEGARELAGPSVTGTAKRSQRPGSSSARPP